MGGILLVDGEVEVQEDIDELRSKTVRKLPCLTRQKLKNRKIKDDP